MIRGISMTDEARNKILELEGRQRNLMAQEGNARKLGKFAEVDALLKQIDALSGDIARAYYAALHS
jgi:hypothetical protein